MLSKNVNLLEGNIAKGLIQMGLPLMFLNLINSLYNVVDTFFVGQIGELEVGAVSLINPIMNCEVAFATGLNAAALALISMYIGADNRKKGDEIATHLVLLAIGIGAFATMVVVFACDPILRGLGTPADIYQDSQNYLIGIAFDFVGMFLLSLFHAIHQANGDSRTGVILNSIAAVLNIVLDPLFIFGLDMGVMGAAIATALSKLLMVPFMFYKLYHDHNMTTICFRRYPLTWLSVKEIMAVTLPASTGQFLAAFGFIIMNKAIITYGTIAMSAYGIGGKITNLFFIPVNSIGGALSAFVGQNLGAGNALRARKCYHKGMFLCTTISVVITVFGWIFTPYVIPWFVNSPSAELLELANEYTFYAVGTAFFMGWFQILNGVFNGSGHTNYTLLIAIFRLWGSRIPLIYLFKYLGFGPTGIWYSMVISNILCCLLGQFLYQLHRWEKPTIKIE